MMEFFNNFFNFGSKNNRRYDNDQCNDGQYNSNNGHGNSNGGHGGGKHGNKHGNNGHGNSNSGNMNSPQQAIANKNFAAYCSQCGSGYIANAKFCGQCGNSISSSK